MIISHWMRIPHFLFHSTVDGQWGRRSTSPRRRRTLGDLVYEYRLWVHNILSPMRILKSSECKILKGLPCWFILVVLFIDKKTKPQKGDCPCFVLSGPDLSGHSPCLLISPTLGPSSSISRPTLPTPQPDTTIELFCFEKHSPFCSRPGMTSWLQAHSPQTRCSMHSQTISILFSNTKWIYIQSLSLSAICNPCNTCPIRQSPFKTFCPFSHQYIPEMPMFQYPNSIFLLVPKHLSAAANSPVRLYFLIFLVQKAWPFFLCCAWPTSRNSQAQALPQLATPSPTQCYHIPQSHTASPGEASIKGSSLQSLSLLR